MFDFKTADKNRRMVTRNGSKAFIWEWGKNIMGQSCWLGTVKGTGFCAWNEEGKDIEGDEDFDIVGYLEPLTQ